MFDFVVVCPRNTVTGGPEALHQLVDAGNRVGYRSGILYWPPEEDAEIPSPYLKYRVESVDLQCARLAKVVVLPETLFHLGAEFPSPKKFLWWLSVDNFVWSFLAHRSKFFSNRPVSKLVALLGTSGIQRLLDPVGKVGKGFDGHLVQSQYAANFVSPSGFSPFTVGDYLSQVMTEDEGAVRHGVVTNGNKGQKQAQRYENLGPECRLTALRGLAPGEINKAFLGASVYIDFGTHPGRDRMPREAAAHGCVIFVRNRGAAMNQVDVELPEFFKFSATPLGLRRLRCKVAKVMNEPDIYRRMQDHYRKSIRGEEERFLSDVSYWLASVI